MSRFVEEKRGSEEKYLLYEDENKLISELQELYKKSERVLYDYIKNFSGYKVIELSEKYVLTLMYSIKGVIELAIGYPFPIYITEVKQISEPVRVRLSLRGNELRKYQRGYLVGELQKIYKNVNYTYIDNREFENIAKDICKGSINKQMLYVDPNCFIGDSIIELCAVDILMKENVFKKVCVVSRNYRHLIGDFDIYDYKNNNLESAMMGCDVVFISDLVDTHISNTITFINKYRPQKPIFVLGRNIIIYPEIAKTEVYFLDKPDIFLTNQGIHNYINDYIHPFFPKLLTSGDDLDEETVEGKSTIFINMFSSLKEKDISVEFVVQFVKKVYKDSKYKILLSMGMGDAYSKKTVEELLEKLPFECKEIVTLIKDEGLADLVKILKHYGVIAAITPDTSVSHILTRMKYLNFTIYNIGFWDNRSVLSLSTESPIGYCSKSKWQIPVLLEKDAILEVKVEAILGILDAIVKKKMKNLNVPEFGNNYFQNRLLHDTLLKKIKCDKLRENICEVYDFSSFSLCYSDLKESEILINNIFEISPLIKVCYLCN